MFVVLGGGGVGSCEQDHLRGGGRSVGELCVFGGLESACLSFASSVGGFGGV